MTPNDEHLRRAGDRARRAIQQLSVVQVDTIKRRARRTTATRRAIGALAVGGSAAGLVLVAVRGSESPQADRQQTRVEQVTVEQAAYELPLDGLLAWRPSQEGAQFERVGELTQSCMMERGFEYPLSEYPGSAPALSIVDHPFGPWNARDSEVGYTRPDIPAVSDQAEAYGSSLRGDEAKAWHTAHMGSGEGQSKDVTLVDGTTVSPGFSDEFMESCAGQAADELFAGEYLEYEAYRSAVADYEEQAWQLTDTDPMVTSAVGEWSACMTSKGYSYEHPDEPAELFAQPQLGDGEADVLAADLTCKSDAELFDTWFTAKSAHETDLAAGDREVVDEFWRIKNAALDRLN